MFGFLVLRRAHFRGIFAVRRSVFGGEEFRLAESAAVEAASLVRRHLSLVAQKG